VVIWGPLKDSDGKVDVLKDARRDEAFGLHVTKSVFSRDIDMLISFIVTVFFSFVKVFLFSSKIDFLPFCA
jgi:hypothetical protein